MTPEEIKALADKHWPTQHGPIRTVMEEELVEFVRAALAARLSDLAQALKDRDEARRDLANEQAKGIHSCGTDCSRDACVNRRLRAELEEARAQLGAAVGEAQWLRALLAPNKPSRRPDVCLDADTARSDCF